MIITKKALSRRTVLRGMGAAVALPLLDAMVPAMAAARRSRAPSGRGLPPERRHLRSVAAEGCRRRLRALAHAGGTAAVPRQIDRRHGSFSDEAEALGDGGGDHSRASGTYLTGVHVQKVGQRRQRTASPWTRLPRRPSSATRSSRRCN